MAKAVELSERETWEILLWKGVTSKGQAWKSVAALCAVVSALGSVCLRCSEGAGEMIHVVHSWNMAVLSALFRDPALVCGHGVRAVYLRLSFLAGRSACSASRQLHWQSLWLRGL